MPQWGSMSTQTSHEHLLSVFRSTFRRHASGVVVITAYDADGRPVGFTATSIASLSAVPPRATFNMAQTASSYPAITVGNRLAVNFLGEDAIDLGMRFAGETSQRFAGDHWHEHEGVPVLPGAGAVLFAQIAAVHTHDTNAVVVLDVIGGEVRSEPQPLLYHDREYGTLVPIARTRH